MKEACGVVGIVAPETGRRATLLRRTLRSAAPRPGVGRAWRPSRRADHRREEQRTRAERLRRLDAARPRRHVRHRPHPLLDVGLGELDRRAAGLPIGGRVGLRPRATTGTSPTPTALADETGILFTSMLSDSDLVAELLAREVDAGVTLPEASARRSRALEGAFSHGPPRSGRRARGARPLRVPPALPRTARHPKRRPEGWVVASESPALDVIGATFVRETCDPVNW